MGTIGGIFSNELALSTANGFFSRICPSGSDVSFMMSGRCGIYRCLLDLARHDTRKVAYVPMYTCETVLAPFLKAGYQLRFYEVDRQLHSVFDPAVLDEISVLSLCGYYGFSNYDHDFVQQCKDRGVTIFEDATHSILSADGIDPLCDYVAGSFRKWMGVPCGGFAIKYGGSFAVPCLPVDPTHLDLRYKAIETGDGDVFWEGEMLLRRIFDCNSGDETSEHILRYADLETISRRRRENFQALLDGMPQAPQGFSPVFSSLPEGTVPSHFVLYADDRPHLQEFLKERDIRSTVYWPKAEVVDLTGHDTVAYIYDHIVAVPCVQRYTPADMRRITDALGDYARASRA